MAVVVAVVVVIVVVALVLLARRGRRSDPVDSFRRQIDALSPEARRPTISQAQGADDAGEPDAADVPDAADTSDQGGPDSDQSADDPVDEKGDDDES